MGLKYIVLHKDVLYYRRRYPKNLKPAFGGKEFYRHSLKLPKTAPDSKITAAWQFHTGVKFEPVLKVDKGN